MNSSTLVHIHQDKKCNIVDINSLKSNDENLVKGTEVTVPGSTFDAVIRLEKDEEWPAIDANFVKLGKVISKISFV